VPGKLPHRGDAARRLARAVRWGYFDRRHQGEGAAALVSWLGIVQATLAILSLVSLVFFPAALLILLSRMLGLVWCIAVGLVLAFDKQRGPGAEG
jgi:hypothetical protein